MGIINYFYKFFLDILATVTTTLSVLAAIIRSINGPAGKL